MNVTSLAKYNIPSKPGIYMFLDASGKPLYIGRATSLKDRLRSYFAADLISTRGPRIVDMVTKAKRIKIIELGSVLEAVIREGILIRTYQPTYNVDDKDNKSSLYVIVTDEELPRVFTERVRDFDKKKDEHTLEYKVRRVFGPYPHTSLIKDALKILRKLFPFRDKKADGSAYERFYVDIGRSPRIDSKDVAQRLAYAKTIEYLIAFFDGKRKKLVRDLTKDMHVYAKDMRFEDAHRIKKLISALEHIHDIALLKRERTMNKMRIEAYDVAHMSGTERVGAMVVMTDAGIMPSEQRYFKLSVDKNDDVAGLAEILSRRLTHSEWQYPDLIVVDGGESQLKIAQQILAVGRFDIPVVAVVKDERHKAKSIIGDTRYRTKLKKEIIEINAEVHRVVLGYHRRRMRNRMSHLI